LHPEQRALVGLGHRRERRRHSTPRILEWEVEHDLDLVTPGHRGERRTHVLDGVEPLRRRIGGGGYEHDPAHAVDPEGAQVVAQVVERGEVPASCVEDEAVRAELAM